MKLPKRITENFYKLKVNNTRVLIFILNIYCKINVMISHITCLNPIILQVFIHDSYYFNMGA